ncbi:squalene synthase HpnC [Thiohalobacter sp. IOR34]|uniref:squalene synthase HpnC n=1 Tax=Thiohalobacter sp. IOR34 TaxID=3057176 RepID=UPI0025B00D1D|nr:squalene synthase HpnC [Thiohalobacter sp. IOR34]WJW76657.1 squalene synthase HpnC [Thiohalobacter sp. IOR34]
MSTIDAAYRHCQQLARRHYENFPVASLLLPPGLRRPLAAIYAFARRADDLADEGDAPVAERLAALDALQAALEACSRGQTLDDPLFVALGDCIRSHQLPLDPFTDLLDAFRQDLRQSRYTDFAELLDYCRRSANPVGRLVLLLSDNFLPQQVGYSDAICSALQLTNMLQDLGQDLDENDRLYLPQDELAEFGVTEAQLRERRDSPALRRLLQFQAERTRRLLHSGAPLGNQLGGRLGIQIRLTVLAADRILQRLLDPATPPFARPRLSRRDWLSLAWHALPARR